MIDETYLDSFLSFAIQEDIGDGDHTSRSIISEDTTGKAKLLVKDNGILAGVDVTLKTFSKIDPSLKVFVNIQDGSNIHPGNEVLFVEGKILSILQAERLVLNILQRMSGIATQTHEYVKLLEGTQTRILDTRKTTPGMRLLEKEAVRIGGGVNHRVGLYDMILIKDNHIDFAGGIKNALNKTKDYLLRTQKSLDIEIEARNLKDIEEIMLFDGIKRILLDNFDIPVTRKAVERIGDFCETESSGGITQENIREYAECGVDYISVGALTHQIKSLDMSLKAIF